MGGFADESSLVPKGAAQEALQERINELGFGAFQMLMLLSCGGMMAAEGGEILTMGSLTKLLAKEWDLSPFMKGFMVSLVYVGFAFGNLISGNLGDRYGRRPTILLAYVFVGVFGMLCSIAQNPAAMTILRFFVGIGVGCGFPCVFSLIPEVCPTHIRGAVSSCMIGFMTIGELWASLGVLFIDPTLGNENEAWRNLCRWSAIPPFCFLLFSIPFLFESPLLLARQGRQEELRHVLTKMAFFNRMPDRPFMPEGDTPLAAPVEAQLSVLPPPPPTFSWWASANKIFTGRYAVTSTVLFVAAFAKDFSYFGLNYVFPQYFQALTAQHPSWDLSTGDEMVICSLVAMPGVALAVAITQSKSISNINFLTGVAFAAGLGACGLLRGLPGMLHNISACVVKLLTLCYFIADIVYTTEVFPTSFRTTAVGICISFGRLGSISSPIVFQLTEVYGGFNPFWIIIICLMWFVAVCGRLFLTIETKGQTLADDSLPGEDGIADVSYGATAKGKLTEDGA